MRQAHHDIIRFSTGQINFGDRKFFSNENTHVTLAAKDIAAIARGYAAHKRDPRGHRQIEDAVSHARIAHRETLQAS